MPTSESGVYMITAKDINYGSIQYDTARCTTQFAYRNLTPKSRPKQGDLLLTKDGSLGRLALVDARTICINQSVALLRPNSKAVPQFIKALLETPRYQTRMLEDAGGSTIKHIYITIVNRMPIAVPPTRVEQEAIAEVLSDAERLVVSLELLVAKKARIKQGVMQEFMNGKRRLSGFESAPGFVPTDFGRVPKDWEIRELGTVLKSTQLGGNYKNSERETDWPLVKMGNLGRGTIKLNKLEFIDPSQPPSPKDRLRNDDVLFNTRNTPELVGKVALWRGELSEAYFNSNLMRLEFDEANISKRFMSYLFNTSDSLKSLRGIAIGTTSVAAIYHRHRPRRTR